MTLRQFVKKTGRRQNLASWLLLGPDDTLPDQQSEWVLGQGWFDNAFLSVSSYIAAASGTFTRGSDGTYFDKSGLLITAGPDVLRLDHDPTTLVALGLRVEGQRTNRFTSSSFNSGWTTQNVSRNFAGIVGLSGNATTRVADSGGAVNHNLIYATSPAWGGEHTVSFLVKNEAIPRVVFEPALSAFLDNMSTPHGPVIACQDDWFRFALTTPSNFNSGESYSVNLTTRAGGAQGIGSFFHSEYAQIEEAPFASSPIFSEGAAATRLADSLTYAAAGTVEGSVLISARTPLGVGGDQNLWCWDDGTTGNRYRLYRVSSTSLMFEVRVGGADVVVLNLGEVADDTDFTVAASWRVGSFHASLNGAVAVSSEAYVGALPAVTTLREGRSSVGEEWFGTIARMARYSVAYTAEQVRGMSA